MLLNRLRMGHISQFQIGKKMNLKEYKVMTGLTVQQLAIALQISMQSIYNYLDGAPPTEVVAKKIEKNTSGRITAKELLGQK